MIKVSGLTALNVDALAQTVQPDEPVDLTATTAIFHMDAVAALAAVQLAIDVCTGPGHPRASLYAVRRKLVKAGNAPHRCSYVTNDGLRRCTLCGNIEAKHTGRWYPIEQASEAAQAKAQQMSRLDLTAAAPSASIPDVSTEAPHLTTPAPQGDLRPEALFLLSWNWVNAFDCCNVNRPAGDYRCKVCGDVVRVHERRDHFNADKARSANTTAQIRADRRATMAGTDNKQKRQTAREQGFPEVYLGENGNFRPGLDASAKSDLVESYLGGKGKRHTFTKEEAKRLLDLRGWFPYVAKRQAAIEADAKRKQAKADKAKEAAAAKKADAKPAAKPTAKGEAKPDPKPANKRRSTAKAAA